ncbi:MAG: hypothetical protein F4093_06910 [Gammaproteobacteria bacterium]|nr:hypothetical protein [Gammaproteobacteria bacterium]
MTSGTGTSAGKNPGDCYPCHHESRVEQGVIFRMQSKSMSAETDPEEDILRRFTKLKTAPLQGGGRAPHKYLLVLFAIGKCLKGEGRMMSYETVRKGLSPLLSRYAPHTKAIKPHLPFWHLANDGVWEIDRPDLVRGAERNRPVASTLAARFGGLTEPDHDVFSRNPDIAMRVVRGIMSAYFPRSLHDEILLTAGIEVDEDMRGHEPEDLFEKFEWNRRRVRDPAFRGKVVHAYENQCAVCRFSVRLDRKTIGLEAAHIRWHEQNGPPVVPNGLALCAIHHKLFDAGAFTISPEGFRVHVSSLTAGEGNDELLGRFDSKPLSFLPREKSSHPGEKHLLWHINNAYRGSPDGLV